MATARKSRLIRPLQKLPAHVRSALRKRGVWRAYQARPSYQQNDYLRWIDQAKRPETQQKRLEQMLAELKQGDVYMRMAWHAGDGGKPKAAKKKASKKKVVRKKPVKRAIKARR